MRIASLARTVWALGLRSCAKVYLHRCKEKAGYYKSALLVQPAIQFEGFRCAKPPGSTPRNFSPVWLGPLLAQADQIVQGKLECFGGTARAVGSPPRWFEDPFTRRSLENSGAHWSELREFSLSSGDIKHLWEMSRFTWAPILARAYRASGRVEYLECLNSWISSWCQSNPPQSGPNWRCAQECSIRCMNLMLAADLLGELSELGPGFKSFLLRHAERILLTLDYSDAQKNNHATSEAAALMIIGEVLGRGGASDSIVSRCIFAGRKLLERAIGSLVAADGSFSQRSVNYHRVFLDTVGLLIYFGKRFEFQALSAAAQDRVRAAWNWLYQIVDLQTGLAPNLGANDGTLLYRLTSCPYPDFRPTLALLAAQLFEKGLTVNGPHEETLGWLGYAPAAVLSIPQETELFDQGGYAAIRSGELFLLANAPRFLFRPSHADILHLDVRWRGQPLLIDAGTWSYFEREPDLSSTSAHNTIEFNHTDQMPKLSRFLFGDWPVVHQELSENGSSVAWEGNYQASSGCAHSRKIELSESTGERRAFLVQDRYRNAQSATLRWRLGRGEWKGIPGGVRGENCELRVEGDIISCELRRSWHCPSYQTKEEDFLLVVELSPGAGSVDTIVSLW